MCGIAGLFQFDGQAPNLQILKAMTDALFHRGPDDAGLFCRDAVGLGHRRLSILDLSAAGHQPMSNARQDLWIVFNGEIYNYLELRHELSALGYTFATDTDTEVILAAYEAYGTDCLAKFNGMWSFALWDAQKQALFCSRDRFGVKPFYYYADQAFFAFASEPKALFQHPHIPNAVRDTAIYTFLMTGISNQDDASFFADIDQISPGHYLWIADGQIQVVPFWNLAEASQTDTDFSGDPTTHFRELFTDSVRLRLRSDVPIGTCLSGGLDSSAIVCTARQLVANSPDSPYRQETFSSCFDNPVYDERPFIHKVLEKTQAHPNFLFPSPEQFIRDIDALIYTQDEPFASLSIFAQWCVMKTVQSRGIKVLLDGQGSDEMLAGYGYDSILWAELFRTGQWKALGQEIFHQIATDFRPVPRRMGRMLLPEGLSFSQPVVHQFLRPEFAFVHRDTEQKKKRAPYPKPYHLKNALFTLMFSSLLPILRYEDRNSMAFSIEARIPFLDYRLVSFVFSLPATQYIHNGWSKWILRQAMQDILPEDIRWRRDKMGFVTPQELWLKQELSPWVRDILNDPRFLERPYWKGRQIRSAYEDWVEGKPSPIRHCLWPILSTELWLRRFIDRRANHP